MKIKLNISEIKHELLAFFALIAHFIYFIDDKVFFGDGLRILPFIETFNSNAADGNYFGWNQYKFMGTRILSEPENFIDIALFFGENVGTKAMLLNIIIFLLIFLIFIVVYKLLRLLKFTEFASSYSALLLVCSGVIANHLKSGNVQVLINILALWVILYLTSKAVKENYSHKLSVIIAFIIANYVLKNGQYAIVYLIPTYLFILYISHWVYHKENLNIKLITKYIVIVAVLSSLIIAPGLFIMIEAYNGSLNAYSGSRLITGQVHAITFFNTFMHIGNRYNEGVFGGAGPFFISAIFPLVIGYLITIRKDIDYVSQKIFYAGMFLMTFGFVFITGRVFTSIGSLINIMANTPILSMIRWTIPFQHIIIFAFTFLTAVFLEQINKRNIEELKASKRWISILLIPMLFVLFLGIEYTNKGLHEIPYLNTSLKYVGNLTKNEILINALIVFSLVLFLILGIGKWKNIVVVVILSQALMIQPFSEAKRLGYQGLTAKYKYILNNDSDFYYFHSYRISRLGIPKVRNLYEFSIMTNKDYLEVLSNLYNKEIDKNRVHWISPSDIKSWNFELAKKIGLKYILVSGSEPIVPNGWSLTAKTNWDYLLENKDYVNPVKIFKKFKYEPDDSKAFNNFTASKNDELIYVNHNVINYIQNQSISDGCAEYVRLKESASGFDINANTCSQKNIIFVPYLFDEKFAVKINNKRADYEKVNGKFIGIPVDKGEFKIELRFVDNIATIQGLLRIFFIPILLAMIFYIVLNRRENVADKSLSKNF